MATKKKTTKSLDFLTRMALRIEKRFDSGEEKEGDRDFFLSCVSGIAAREGEEAARKESAAKRALSERGGAETDFNKFQSFGRRRGQVAT